MSARLCSSLSIFFLYFCHTIAVPVQKSPGLLCNSYPCLQKLENPDELDKGCRTYGSRHCYCCGGHKKYIEYGRICRRFCLKVYSEGQENRTPCIWQNYTGSDEESLFDLDAPYPVVPQLIPIEEIICNKSTLVENVTILDNATTVEIFMTTIKSVTILNDKEFNASRSNETYAPLNNGTSYQPTPVVSQDATTTTPFIPDIREDLIDDDPAESFYENESRHTEVLDFDPDQWGPSAEYEISKGVVFPRRDSANY